MVANFTNWYFRTAKRRDAWVRFLAPFVSRSYGGRLIGPFTQLTVRLFGGRRSTNGKRAVVSVRN